MAKTNTLFALHTIERPSKDGVEEIAPGRLFEAADRQASELLGLDAARPATEDEIAVATARASRAAPRQATVKAEGPAE